MRQALRALDAIADPALPLAAWSLASGWLLLWAAAAVIPLLIHLWSRRKQREVAWAAMEFLLAAIQSQARRMRIEQLILLAVRTAILLLLALALAEPILTGVASPLAAAGSSPRTHTVLVLDGSYSMQYRWQGSTLFDKARRQAIDRVRQGRQGDGFTVVLMADPPETIIGDPAFDAGDVVAQLERLQPRPTGADLEASLVNVAERIATAQRRGPRFALHEVELYSDLGQTTWQAAGSEDARRLLGELAGQAQLNLSVLGPEERDNAAVTRFTSSDAFTPAGKEIALEVAVSNFGASPIDRAIELSADARTIGRRELRIPANGSTAATFVYRVETPGQHVVQAVIAEDALPIDDRRELVVVAADTIRVLCIAGKPQAADFIALALAPDESARLRIAPEIATEAALRERDLNDFDCIFLCNVGRIGGEEARLLLEYVQAGGGLVTILGDRVDARAYNEQLVGESEASLLPARLEQVVTGGPHHFVPRYEQPIAAPFRGHERAGLLTAPVWRYVKLAPLEQAVEQLAFDSGDPALLTSQVGLGRVVLFATAASTASVDREGDRVVPWTALVSWPSFPPLVHQMLRFAVGGRTAARNVLVGDALRWDRIAGEGEPVELLDPGGASTPVSGVAGDGPTIVANARQNGIYRIRGTNPALEPFVYSASIDTRESDLRRVAPTRLPAELRGEREPVVEDEPVAAEPGRTELFRWVLAAVFALVLGDSALACWFGRAT